MAPSLLAQDEKKPLSATPGENPDRRDRAEVTLSGLLSVLTPTSLSYIKSTLSCNAPRSNRSDT